MTFNVLMMIYQRIFLCGRNGLSNIVRITFRILFMSIHALFNWFKLIKCE